MIPVTLDYETFYSDDYSLGKMTMVEYLRDPRFQVVGASFKVGDRPAVWTHDDDKLKQTFDSIPWDQVGLICQNTRFDGAILAWYYGKTPKIYFDTMGMAQAKIYPKTGSASLAKIAEHFKLPKKQGWQLASVKGLRKEQMSAEQLRSLGEYCCLDDDLTYAAFQKLLVDFPRDELDLIDAMLRMYIHPEIMLDKDMLKEHLGVVKREKDELLKRANQHDKDALNSNAKFAELLIAAGAVPPLKISPTTDKEIYAFAKKDTEFLELQDHPNPEVQALVAARLGTKSTLEETRTARMLKISEQGLPFPIPLKYYGAHTGRASGDDKYNVQNLTRDTRKSKLRLSMTAPKGKVFVVVDSRQIEARMNAWHACERKLIKQFANGEDVYSSFASDIYGVPVNADDNPMERFVGKQGILSLGYGAAAQKFKLMLATTEPFLTMELVEAMRVVEIYRSTHPSIVNMWSAAGRALPYIASDVGTRLGICELRQNKILLPNGMALQYHNLRRDENDDRQWIYNYGRQIKKIYGAKLIENIIQALARIVVMGKIVGFRRDYGLTCCTTTHDDLAFLVDEREADDALAIIMAGMRTPPDWAEGLPLDAEGGINYRYGAAK